MKTEERGGRVDTRVVLAGHRLLIKEQGRGDQRSETASLTTIVGPVRGFSVANDRTEVTYTPRRLALGIVLFLLVLTMGLRLYFFLASLP